MYKLIFICLIFVIVPVISNYHHNPHQFRTSRKSELSDEASVVKFLYETYEEKASKISSDAAHAEWNFLVDLDNKTKAEYSINATLAEARFQKDTWSNYFKDLDTSTFRNGSIVRQVERLSVLGNAALSDDKLAEYIKLQNEMTEIYSTAKICPYKNPRCNLTKNGISLDPDIEDVMATSCDYDELLYTWTSWRDATGLKMKDKFLCYVVLSNEAAKANNFTDKGQMWRWEYEIPNFEKVLDRIWKQVEPLYNELHFYVLNRLKTLYQREIGADTDGLIPAHLLGNMWGQSWINLRDLVKPFPEVNSFDLTVLLKAKNFTTLKMFDVANEFFTSLGLKPMNMAYNTSLGALIEKPKCKKVLCHASAWDFCDHKDYRIKMCANVTQKDFFTIHHELGHIQYYLQYSHLPVAFRQGANPGFHEAIGDVIALSVATPKHLYKIGLLEDYYSTRKTIINALMDVALEKVAFLPFALLLDKWRWDIFSDRIDPMQWNDHYWNYREKYQKVKSPMPRTEADLDPASKFHVIADSQYISYFFAHILEFQIYKAMCASDGVRVLSECDFYKCESSGNKLQQGMELGASQHWKNVLEIMTGERELSGAALLEYFNPLYNYLRHVNGQVARR